MGLSNYEKQKRWRARHRALYNLQQRNRRKNLRGDAESTVCTGQPERENDRPTVPAAVGEIPTPATTQPFTTKKVGELNMIVMPKGTPVGEPVIPATRPKILRDDFGNVLTPEQFEEWQERKRKGKEKGYVPDEYSQ